jgi:hypothetical protein
MLVCLSAQVIDRTIGEQKFPFLLNIVTECAKV